MLPHKLKYVVIDDNELDILLINFHLSNFSWLENHGNFTNANDALTAMEILKPEIVFTDIEMPELNGLELLQKIKASTPVTILTSSHLQYAIEGFELEAFDFISKPLNEQRIKNVVTRIENFWSLKNKATQYDILIDNYQVITIKDGHHYIKIQLSDIIYLEALQDYTKVVTREQEYLTLTTLTAFVQKLANPSFLRIHRSYAVATTKIKEIHSNKVICGNIELPVGKTYRQAITQLMK